MEQQDELIQHASENVIATERELEGANKDLSRCVNSARAARKKRQWCFWISVLILIIIGVIVAVVIVTNNKK